MSTTILYAYTVVSTILYAYTVVSTILYAYTVVSTILYAYTVVSTVLFDTTSTLLLLTSHFLMHHPEVQDRARNEAVQVLKDKVSGFCDLPEPDYEDLAKLEYIDQVLSEVLRLYPASLIISSCRLYLHRFVASGISRRSEQDYHLPGHLTIPRGLPVIMALPAMHYSPKIWSEPHKFDPDRFAPEARSSIPPLAYQPFGAGPRTCLGMKLALLASRLVVARLLLRYRLRPGPDTDQYLSAPWETINISHRVQAVVVEAEWKAWECPHKKNEDTVALGKLREQIKVELGAKEGNKRVPTGLHGLKVLSLPSHSHPDFVGKGFEQYYFDELVNGGGALNNCQDPFSGTGQHDRTVMSSESGHGTNMSVVEKPTCHCTIQAGTGRFAEEKGRKEGSNESSTPRGKDGVERTYHKEGLLLKAKEESGRV
ncbi:hypothetical protein LAZ67_7003633, partial [Cordylochernes scorpioides]